MWLMYPIISLSFVSAGKERRSLVSLALYPLRWAAYTYFVFISLRPTIVKIGAAIDMKKKTKTVVTAKLFIVRWQRLSSKSILNRLYLSVLHTVMMIIYSIGTFLMTYWSPYLCILKSTSHCKKANMRQQKLSKIQLLTSRSTCLYLKYFR